MNQNTQVSPKFEFIPIFQKTLQKIQVIFQQFKNSVKFRTQLYLVADANLSHNELRKLIKKQTELCFQDFEKNILFYRDHEIAQQLKKLKNSRNLATVTQELNLQTAFINQILDKIENPITEQPLVTEAPEQANQHYLVRVNSKHLHHAIKRMLKAVKIQIEDYQSSLGVYALSNFVQQQKEVDELMIKLIQEIEIPCENWLKRWDNKFTEVIDSLANDQSLTQRNILQKLLGDKYQQFDLHLVKSWIIRILEAPTNKQNNCTILDLFPEYQRQQANPSIIQSNISVNSGANEVEPHAQLPLPLSNFNMYLCLLQSGNTVDGIVISSKLIHKILNPPDSAQNGAARSPPHSPVPNTATTTPRGQLNQVMGPHPPIADQIPSHHQQFSSSFEIFNDWKRRRCHGCLEYVVEASRAISCINLIRSENSCKRLYCYSCVVSFYSYKVGKKALKEHHNEYVNIEFSPKSKQIKAKKSQPYWLRACQNILFTCPCCLGECTHLTQQHAQKALFDQNGAQIMHSNLKAQISACKLFQIINRHPQNLMHQHLIIYLTPAMQSQIPNAQSRQFLRKKFVLAQIVGYDPNDKHFKISLLNKEQARKALISPDKRMQELENQQETTIMSAPSLSQTLFFLLSTVIEHNRSFLQQIGILNPNLSQQQACQLIRKKTQNNNIYKSSSKVFKMLIDSINTAEGGAGDGTGNTNQSVQNQYCTLDIRSNIMELIDNLKNYDRQEWRLLDKYAIHLDKKDVLQQVQVGEILKDHAAQRERSMLIEHSRKVAEKRLEIFKKPLKKINKDDICVPNQGIEKAASVDLTTINNQNLKPQQPKQIQINNIQINSSDQAKKAQQSKVKEGVYLNNQKRSKLETSEVDSKSNNHLIQRQQDALIGQPVANTQESNLKNGNQLSPEAQPMAGTSSTTKQIAKVPKEPRSNLPAISKLQAEKEPNNMAVKEPSQAQQPSLKDQNEPVEDQIERGPRDADLAAIKSSLSQAQKDQVDHSVVVVEADQSLTVSKNRKQNAINTVSNNAVNPLNQTTGEDVLIKSQGINSSIVQTDGNQQNAEPSSNFIAQQNQQQFEPSKQSEDNIFKQEKLSSLNAPGPLSLPDHVLDQLQQDVKLNIEEKIESVQKSEEITANVCDVKEQSTEQQLVEQAAQFEQYHTQLNEDAYSPTQRTEQPQKQDPPTHKLAQEQITEPSALKLPDQQQALQSKEDQIVDGTALINNGHEDPSLAQSDLKNQFLTLQQQNVGAKRYGRWPQPTILSNNMYGMLPMKQARTAENMHVMSNYRLRQNKIDDLQKQLEKEFKKIEKLKKKNADLELITQSEKKIDMILQKKDAISKLQEDNEAAGSGQYIQYDGKLQTLNDPKLILDQYQIEQQITNKNILNKELSKEPRQQLEPSKSNKNQLKSDSKLNQAPLASDQKAQPTQIEKNEVDYKKYGEFKQDIGHIIYFKPVELQIHQKKNKQLHSEDEEDAILREEIIQSRKNDDKFYMKRFKWSKRLKEHIKFQQEFIAKKPEAFKGLFIYKLKDSQSKIWQRCKVLDYAYEHDSPNTQEQQSLQSSRKQLMFYLQHQNSAKDREHIPLASTQFLLDQNTMSYDSDNHYVQDKHNAPGLKQKRALKKLQKAQKLGDKYAIQFNQIYQINRILVKERSHIEEGKPLDEAINIKDAEADAMHADKQIKFLKVQRERNKLAQNDYHKRNDQIEQTLMKNKDTTGHQSIFQRGVHGQINNQINSSRRRFNRETRRIIVIDPGSEHQNSQDQDRHFVKVRTTHVRFKRSVNLQKFQSRWVENMKSLKRKSSSACNSQKGKINNGSDEQQIVADDEPADKLWVASASSEDADDSRSVNIDNTKNIDYLKMHYYREIIEHYSNQLRQLNLKNQQSELHHDTNQQYRQNRGQLILQPGVVSNNHNNNHVNNINFNHQIVGAASQNICSASYLSNSIAGGAESSNHNSLFQQKKFRRGLIEDRINQSMQQRKPINQLLDMFRQNQKMAGKEQLFNGQAANQQQHFLHQMYLQKNNHLMGGHNQQFAQQQHFAQPTSQEQQQASLMRSHHLHQFSQMQQQQHPLLQNGDLNKAVIVQGQPTVLNAHMHGIYHSFQQPVVASSQMQNEQRQLQPNQGSREQEQIEVSNQEVNEQMHEERQDQNEQSQPQIETVEIDQEDQQNNHEGQARQQSEHDGPEQQQPIKQGAQGSQYPTIGGQNSAQEINRQVPLMIVHQGDPAPFGSTAQNAMISQQMNHPHQLAQYRILQQGIGMHQPPYLMMHHQQMQQQQYLNNYHKMLQSSGHGFHQQQRQAMISLQLGAQQQSTQAMQQYHQHYAAHSQMQPGQPQSCVPNHSLLTTEQRYARYEQQGYRKCGCSACQQVAYPALIAQEAQSDDSAVRQQHEQYFQNQEVICQMQMQEQLEHRDQRKEVESAPQQVNDSQDNKEPSEDEPEQKHTQQQEQNEANQDQSQIEQMSNDAPNLLAEEKQKDDQQDIDEQQTAEAKDQDQADNVEADSKHDGTAKKQDEQQLGAPHFEMDIQNQANSQSNLVINPNNDVLMDQNKDKNQENQQQNCQQAVDISQNYYSPAVMQQMMTEKQYQIQEEIQKLQQYFMHGRMIYEQGLFNLNDRESKLKMQLEQIHKSSLQPSKYHPSKNQQTGAQVNINQQTSSANGVPLEVQLQGLSVSQRNEILKNRQEIYIQQVDLNRQYSQLLEIDDRIVSLQRTLEQERIRMQIQHYKMIQMGKIYQMQQMQQQQKPMQQYMVDRSAQAETLFSNNENKQQLEQPSANDQNEEQEQFKEQQEQQQHEAMGDNENVQGDQLQVTSSENKDE